MVYPLRLPTAQARMLAALARPLHRPAEAPRRPGDQRELGIEGVPRAEVAAHVLGHHAHRRLRNSQHLREIGLVPHHAARAPGSTVL